MQCFCYKNYLFMIYYSIKTNKIVICFLQIYKPFIWLFFLQFFAFYNKIKQQGEFYGKV